MITIISACEYRLPIKNFPEININQYKQLIILWNDDLLHEMNPFIKNELYLYNINVINNFDIKNTKNNQYTIPYLNIISISKKHIVNSVYHDGKVSEYQIILYLRSKLFMPDNNNYPINIDVYRILINKPCSILPNITQENEILEDMYQEIAQKLVYKILPILFLHEHS